MNTVEIILIPFMISVSIITMELSMLGIKSKMRGKPELPISDLGAFPSPGVTRCHPRLEILIAIVELNLR
jgi:hypothetical protein